MEGRSHHLLTALLLAAAGCCDGEPTRRAAGASGDVTSATGGSSATSTASTGVGQGGAPPDVTSAVVGSTGSGGGAAGAGGCLDEPSPDECEEAGSPGRCADLGCSFELFDEVTYDGELDQCDHVFDIPGCLPVSACGVCDLPDTTFYWRGDRVIEWDVGCLEGWTPCVGAAGEPPACSCE